MFRVAACFVILAALTPHLRAQVTQHRGETYDEFNTRRIREETANHRNNNPTFTGPGPSSTADWSAWQGLIDRYNARHAPNTERPAQDESAARAQVQDDADHQRLMAKLDAELEAEKRAEFDRIYEPAKTGDSRSLLRVGEYFAGTGGMFLADGVDASEMAFNYYARAGDGTSTERQACLLGAIPQLLDPQTMNSYGERLHRVRRSIDSLTGPEAIMGWLEEGVAKENWVDALLLALWIQHDGECGMEYQFPRRITFEERSVQVRRLLELVKNKVPYIGTYFIGAMIASYPDTTGEYVASLKALLENPSRIPGDADGIYTATVQDEARRLLARLHVRKKIPGARDDVALLLLRTCEGPTAYEALWEASHLILKEEVEVNSARRLEAAADFERIGRAVKKYGPKEFLGFNHRDFFYHAHLLRALVHLEGDFATLDIAPGRNLMAAEAELSLAIQQADSPELRTDGEAILRYRAMSARFPTDAAFPRRESNGAVLAFLRQSTNSAAAQITLGLLSADAQNPEHPADAGAALRQFSAALSVPGCRMADAYDVLRSLLRLSQSHPSLAESIEPLANSYAERARLSKDQRLQLRISLTRATDPVRAAIWTAITQPGGLLQDNLATALAAIGDNPEARAWLAANTLTGEARNAAFEKLDKSATRLLARSLIAYTALTVRPSVAQAIAAARDLDSMRLHKAFEAELVLARLGPGWRGGLLDSPHTARWVAPAITRLQAFGSPRYEWPADQIEVENFLFALPDSFWNQPPSRQIARACVEMEKANLRHRISTYLAYEEKFAAPDDAETRAGILLARAYCAALGLGQPRNLDEAARFHASALSQLPVAAELDPAIRLEVEQALRVIAPENRDLASLAARIRGDAAALAALPPATREQLYAWIIGPDSPKGPLTPSAADRAGNDPLTIWEFTAENTGVRDSIWLLRAFVLNGHLPAYRELVRRADAGESDALCQLVSTLFTCSLANAPLAMKYAEQIPVDHRENFVAAWIQRPGPGDAILDFLRGGWFVKPMVEALSSATSAHLTTAQPFLIDPPQGESWFLRVLRERTATNPDTSELLFQAARIERAAQLPPRETPNPTEAQNLLQQEEDERYEPGISETYLARLRETRDPLALAIALGHEFPVEDDEPSKAQRTAFLSVATRLCALTPERPDPLQAHCLALAHTSLRHLGRYSPAPYRLLVEESKKGHLSAKIELAFLLATQSSVNAPVYYPLFVQALESKRLTETYADLAAAKIAQWRDPATGKANPLLAFLQRHAPAALNDAQPYAIDTHDEYDYAPLFWKDKPPRDQAVLRLLKKHADAGDKAAQALLAEK